MNAVHKGDVDEPGHRSSSKENESRVGTNVSELFGGQVGTSTLVLVMAPAAGLNSHRSNANTERNPSSNILPQRVSCSRGGACKDKGNARGISPV